MRIEAIVGLAMAVWCLAAAERAGKNTWWVVGGGMIFGLSVQAAYLVIEASGYEPLCYGGIRSPVTWISMLFGVAVVAAIRRYCILGRTANPPPASSALGE
jgi:hypothetical protein